MSNRRRPSPGRTHHPKPAEIRPHYLTAEQVGQHLLQIPASSVLDYSRRKHNPLPHRKIGRHTRYLEAEVLAWVDSQNQKAA